MDDYRCSRCGRPTQPQLCEAGVSASCCEDSPLMVPDEDREPLFSASIDITAHAAWAYNMAYGDMHVYFVSPSSKCECDACDRGRLWNAIETELYKADPNWDCPPLRPLTDREESDLLENLWADEQADWTPAMKARHNVMNRDG
jgi:hypothetical protein